MNAILGPGSAGRSRQGSGSEWLLGGGARARRSEGRRQPRRGRPGKSPRSTCARAHHATNRPHPCRPPGLPACEAGGRGVRCRASRDREAAGARSRAPCVWSPIRPMGACCSRRWCRAFWSASRTCRWRWRWMAPRRAEDWDVAIRTRAAVRPQPLEPAARRAACAAVRDPGLSAATRRARRARKICGRTTC